jgi:uncharacterized damage-inducible protein DinB
MLFENELFLFNFNLKYAHKLVKDLSEDQLQQQPAPGMNTPLWILGHLAVALDYGQILFGKEKLFNEDWHTGFSPMTPPGTAPKAIPSKAELLAALDKGHAAFEQVLKAEATPEKLAAPNPFDFLIADFPTVGQLCAHMLTTHEAIHLGQISAWRRAAGLAAV